VGWFEGLWITECENNGKYSPTVTISFILLVFIPGVSRIDGKLSCDSKEEWLEVKEAVHAVATIMNTHRV
jgi:hypothetical protein